MKRFLSTAIVVGLLIQPIGGLAEAVEPSPTVVETAVPAVETEAPAVQAEGTPSTQNGEKKASETAQAADSGVPDAAETAKNDAADTSTAGTSETKAPATDAPATDAPATDAPSTDAPSTDAPATDAPATDAPTTDAPTTDAPATDAPATDAPVTDAPSTDAPTTDAPATDAPSTDAPETDAPSTDAPATDEPTQTPAAGPDILPMDAEIPAGAEAWMLAGEGRACGSLAELVAYAAGETVIRLHVPKVLEIKDAPLKHLSTLKLLPDEDVFRDGEFCVVISKESPEIVEEPVEIDPAELEKAQPEDVADLFVWVEKVEPVVTPDPTDEPEEPVEIGVEVEDYRAAEWSPVHPTFVLSGIPEDKNWVYAVVIYDERIAVLSGNTYTAEAEGVYTVRFAILDEYGDIADASEQYTLWLDHTLPSVSVVVDTEKSYTMHIEATDSMSGVQALSLDGGANWMELNGETSYTYTVSGKTTLEAGMIQVRDAAGNVWISEESYELTKIQTGGSGGWGGGGGGGGGGSGTPAKQHAAAKEPESEAEYDALALELSDEPMEVLTIDGQELALTLELANAEGFEIPEDYQAAFTAELAAWTPAPQQTEDGSQPEVMDQKLDTLLLTAVPEENLGDRFEYRWKFNGEVYRLLANSDVRYLALRVGDDMAVFPTEGFVGGTKYTELKMLGVSTKKFDFTVAMTFNLDPDRIPVLSETDFSESCDIAVMTEVEDMKYVLTSEQKGEMYYYNVCLGPVEMMDCPYGSYGVMKTGGAAEAEGEHE